MSYDFSKVIKTAQEVPIEMPTDKQIQFATEIAWVLNVPLPKIRTKQTYSEFISDNFSTYREYIDSNPDNEEDGLYVLYDGPYF